MKTKLVTTLIFLLFVQIAKGQNNTYPEPITLYPAKVLYQKDIYQDSSLLTVVQQVIRTDSAGIDELKKRFKSWASNRFVNLSEVLVSETDDQIVLLYIVNVPFMIKDPMFGNINSNRGWNVRLVANFKVDRVRITQTDAGNAEIARAPAPSQTITYWFDQTGKIDARKKINRPAYEMVVNWYNQVLSTHTGCGKAITQASSDDW
jgi:hypothetical protein